MQMFYSSLRLTVHQCHDRQSRQELEAASSWQVPVFEQLMKAQREREAFEVAVNYGIMLEFLINTGFDHLNLSSWSRMMDAIITSSEATPATGSLLKVKAMGALV